MNSAPSASRPRLLFLSHNLPFPPDAGAKVRTFHLLKQLAQDFEITALCFGQDDPKRRAAPLAAAAGLERVEAVDIPQVRSTVRRLWDHLRSVSTGGVYTYFRYDSAGFTRLVRSELNSKRWDLVHVDSIDLSRYLGAFGRIPVVCGHHNAESMLLSRRAASERTLARKTYLNLQAARMMTEERSWCNKVAMNIVVSAADLDYLEALGGHARFTIVPNGVDVDYFQPSQADGNGCVFVGASSWDPNLRAMQYFSDRILPLIREQDSSIEITWVGNVAAKHREVFLPRRAFRLVGHVPDTRPFVRDAGCVVVPLLAGGGTRLKILEAWAMGKAVVSTSIGCDGLEAVEGANILIRDDPQEFANAVIRVLSDDTLRRRIGVEGRRTVERSYDWNAIGVGLRATYQRLILNSDVSA